VTIPLIDVFAGPGGLNEGFSSIVDASGPVFRTAASFEMDEAACETLKLRATFRHLRASNSGATTESYRRLLRGEITLADFYRLPEVEVSAKEAHEEVNRVELGSRTRAQSDEVIRRRLGDAADTGAWVLIGGPPCQAYSLAGRARRVGDPTFATDHKHVLYREYLHILEQFAPVAFVMENVKGMLSSQHEGAGIFAQIKADLEHPRPGLEYELRSLVVQEPPASLEPRDYIIRAEDYGIPQRRHRVILFGVKKELAGLPISVLQQSQPVTVRDAIEGLPAVRSRISPLRDDTEVDWNRVRTTAAKFSKGVVTPRIPEVGGPWTPTKSRSAPGPLRNWLEDSDLDGVAQHEARRHMPSDLERYAYLAHMALRGKSPKVMELPSRLIPNHRNATRADAPFADRFRVQRWDEPSTTVVSHISKDGHYYIHPDPSQMRSLTVREAARLQTFPDNYMFVGNRTQQFHQVGNAVPPLLARQIGLVVKSLLASES
jgi:DNA (cytosine-5)-methyltransferase 1